MRPASSSRFVKGLGLLLGLILIVAGTIWIFHGLYTMNDVASHECISRLVRIRTALHQYHMKYGEYPPPVVRNSDAMPLYSWRVLLTEFLCDEIYQSFRLDERWDSPANLHLAKRSTGVFECPSSGASRAGLTDYFAVVEPDGSSRFDWLEHRNASFALKRGLVIVETSTLEVEWSRPIDLASTTILEDRQLGGSVLSCRHRRGPFGVASGESLLKNSPGVIPVSP